MKYAIYMLFLGWAFQAHSQTEVCDTLFEKTTHLNEVIVIGESDKHASLGFYQTTKQNGVESIMQRMSGVSMIRRGNFAPDIVMRGMRGSQVGITVNGMQIFGACTDRMDPITSYVETNNLERIEDGDSESSQGCNSANIAGGVNLKTKQPHFGQGWSGVISSGYGTNGQAFNSLLNLTYGSKKLAVNVNGVYRSQRNYTDGNSTLVNYSQFEKINLSTNLRFRPAPNQVLGVDFIIDNAYNVGYAALPMDVAFAKANLIKEINSFAAFCGYLPGPIPFLCPISQLNRVYGTATVWS